MTADPYARLDAVYLLGALDAEEHLAYRAHLATCHTALTETQIKNLQITESDGRAILALRVPPRP